MGEIITHIKDERTSNIEAHKKNSPLYEVSFCGKYIHNEFHYISVGHAVSDRQAQGRLLSCKKCVAKIVKLLTEI